MLFYILDFFAFHFERSHKNGQNLSGVYLNVAFIKNLSQQ